MLALVVLASSSLAPLGSLAAHIHRAQQVWAYLERLGDVLEAEPEQQAVESGRVELRGGLEVEGLTFR